jgi:hypothetical protein
VIPAACSRRSHWTLRAHSHVVLLNSSMVPTAQVWASCREGTWNTDWKQQSHHCRPAAAAAAAVVVVAVAVGFLS